MNADIDDCAISLHKNALKGYTIGLFENHRYSYYYDSIALFLSQSEVIYQLSKILKNGHGSVMWSKVDIYLIIT